MQKLVLGVTTYNNSADQLRQLSNSVALAARFAPSTWQVEMCVVDNGAPSDWPAEPMSPTKLTSLGNIGFGRSMDRLMEHAFGVARADAFLCLNPDGALHSQALRHLLSAVTATPHALLEARQFPEEHPKPYDPLTGDTPWSSGACLLVPNTVYQRLGGFDPNFFMYLEDVDLSWRARAAGFPVRVVARALFGHSVLHRPPSRQTTHSLLLSARYLALKWSNREFLAWAEDELIKQEFYSQHRGLPEIPTPPRASGRLNKQVADFTRFFSFATARWQD